jgi:type II secretory pathway pseudopilin PulG
MKTTFHQSQPSRDTAQSAFTMVEIALALAVIGFALVAIVGVLPLGLEVQKQNREDTIIDHEANYLMDGLRTGSRGMDDLTNYVMEIRQTFWEMPIGGGPGTLLETRVYNPNPLTTPNSPFDNRPVINSFPLNSGARIVGLLSWPKYMPSSRNGYFVSNNVIAYVRALSGAATEKVPQTDPNVRSLAFNYRLTAEITPVPAPPFTNAIQVLTNAQFAQNLRANLHEIRLLYRWPVKPNGEPGPTGREVYRTQFGGRHLSVQDSNQVLYYFQPTFYRRQS